MSEPATTPHQPLYTLKAIALDLRYGMLRRKLNERPNCLVDFTWRKLHPSVPDGASPADASWSPTAARVDVLLPRNAPDMFLDPTMLAKSYEDAATIATKDLALCVKFIAVGDQPLHQLWERARRFAGAALVEAARLPVIMVLHNTSLTSARDVAPPHVHLIAPARELTVRGWGPPSILCGDEVHQPLVEQWQRTF